MGSKMTTEIFETSSGPVFIKRGPPERIRRESEALQQLDGTYLAPRLIAYPDARTLVIEALSDWVTLHSTFDRADSLTASNLGRTLARVHALPHATFGVAREFVPSLRITPTDLAKLPGEMPQMLSFLQASDDLEDTLTDLRGRAFRPCFTHGDVKLDNILASPAGQVCLVDWEFSGAGNPAWDLGSAIGDCLSRWLLTANVTPSLPLHAWLETATVPQSHSAQMASSIIQGYYELADESPSIICIAECVGIYLIHRAQAWIELYGRFTAIPLILCYVGRRFVLHPAAAFASVLGREAPDR